LGGPVREAKVARKKEIINLREDFEGPSFNVLWNGEIEALIHIYMIGFC